jgi:hypothetical protein
MVFRVGKKVVCVDDDWFPCAPVAGKALPLKGQVFTVSDVHVLGGFELVSLSEYVPRHVFAADHFRPAVEPGIETLNAIRLNTDIPIDAPEGPRLPAPLPEFDPALGVTKYLPKVRP